MKSHLVKRKNALLALEWCNRKYGKSKHNNNYTLKLTFDSNLKDPEFPKSAITAWYDPEENEIRINPKRVSSLKGLVETVIHEYTHFLQDITVMYHKYTNEYKVSYEKHPYEKTANARGKRDWKECRTWVLREIRTN